MIRKRIYMYINELIKRSNLTDEEDPISPYRQGYVDGKVEILNDIANELQEILETPNEETNDPAN